MIFAIQKNNITFLLQVSFFVLFAVTIIKPSFAMDNGNNQAPRTFWGNLFKIFPPKAQIGVGVTAASMAGSGFASKQKQYYCKQYEASTNANFSAFDIDGNIPNVSEDDINTRKWLLPLYKSWNIKDQQSVKLFVGIEKRIKEEIENNGSHSAPLCIFLEKRYPLSKYKNRDDQIMEMARQIATYADLTVDRDGNWSYFIKESFHSPLTSQYESTYKKNINVLDAQAHTQTRAQRWHFIKRAFQVTTFAAGAWTVWHLTQPQQQAAPKTTTSLFVPN